MNTLLERARLLRDHRRFAEAKAALHQYLAGDPESFQGHVELALTGLLEGEDHRAALTAIDTAIGLDADAPHAHSLKSAILNKLARHKEALLAADEARRLDPEDAFAWQCRGIALFELRRLPEAEEAARRSLELDPLDQSASNLLATVLRVQGRLDEARLETDRHLARDPEDPYSFATAGWTALHQGEVKRAEELFRESLRLDPLQEGARLGLREAYKARSGFYRLYLRWVFFMGRFSESAQWIIVIGLYLGYRFGRAALAAIHPLAALPLVFVYMFFVFGTFIAGSIGHLLLLKDRVARLSLTRGEKLDGMLVGTLLIAGLGLLVGGMATGVTGATLVGALLLAATLPGSRVCCNESSNGRLVFGAVTALVLACAALVAYHAWHAIPGTPLTKGPAGGPFSTGLLAAMLSTWLTNVRSLREATPK